MELENPTNSPKPPRRRRKRKSLAEDAPPPTSNGIALWFVIGMAIVGLVCLIVGLVLHGFTWRNTSEALSCLTLGVGFVAIGLLELEWLERIIGFADGLSSGLWWIFWTWNGSLSDSELAGRRGATTIWVLLGIPTFVVGCLLSLRIFEI